ncbi:MAG TPA: hypothetical protein VGB05_05925, partial [Pyrinomonadaceae bacterium]
AQWKGFPKKLIARHCGIAALLTIAEIHDREIATLRESVSTVDERGRQTDERLNALIDTVERYISERRGGNA